MSFESPFKVLYNNAGAEVAVVSGSAMDAARPGIAVLAKDDAGNAQFLNMNASGELLVNAAVDVELSASTDSITVWGDRAALVQDAADDYLLVRDNDAKNAIDAAKEAITGSVEAFQAAFEAEDFASETTLAAFKADNRSDLQAVSGAVDIMNSNLGGKLDTIDSSVGAVETAVDSASSAISGSVVALGSDLGGKLDTIDTSVGAVETAVDNASAAISGSVVALGADIGGKLDTLNAVDFATETTLAAFKADNRSDLQAVSGAIDLFRADFIAEDFASETTLAAFKSDNRSDLQAVSGAIDAMKVELEATLTSIDGKDFATEATLDAFKIENNSNLVALSSSLDRFSFSGGALSVTGNLDVNVGLTASGSAEAGYAAYDTVNIFGDEGVPFAQISGSGEMITVPLGSEGNSLLQAVSGSVHSDVNGNGALLVGLLGSNSKNVLQSSANDILLVSGAGDFNVVATDLDIRPLTSADVVTVDNMVDVSLLATEATLSAVSGAINGLGASVDAVKAAVEAIDAAQLGTITVTATDLDIRDLSSATDSISAVQSGAWSVSQAGDWTVDRKAGTTAAISEEVDPNGKVLDIATDGAYGASFYWSSPAGGICYIALGGAASSTNFTVKLVNGGYYEMPAMFKGDVYASGSGNLYVTAINA